MKMAVVALLLIAGTPALAAPPGPDAAVLRIDSGKTVRLCMDCDAQTATFQVTVLAAVTDLRLAEGETPAVVGVSTSSTRIADMEGRFVPSWKVGPKGQPEAFVVTVTPPLDRAGTYDVVLNLLPSARPGAPRETVQLIVPPASLDAPKTLLVDRTVRWPFETDVRSTPLVVWETGRVAGIRALTLTSRPFAIGSEPIPGLIVSTATSRAPQAAKDAPTAPANDPAHAPRFQVKAGDQATLAYAVSGDLPLGTAQGGVRLTAPELQMAVEIPVQIRSRLSLVHLLLVVAVGLILSWLFKVNLQQRIQLNQARLAAVTLLRNVEKDRAAYPDQPFHDSVKEPMDTLTTSRNGEDIGVMESDRTALDTAWRAARQDLETRRTAFRTQADAWGKIVNLNWELPPRVRSDLDTARGALPQSVALDGRGDVARAAASLSAAQTAAAQAIHLHGRDWQQAARAFFDRLLASGPGISESILRALKTASDTWRSQYPAIAPAPTMDLEEVQPRLRHVMGEYVTGRENLEEMRRRLIREYDEVKDALTAKGIDPSLVAKVRESLDRLSEVLISAADEPEAADANLDALRETLQQSWRAAFGAAAPGNQSVQDAVAQRDFSKAADLLGGLAPLLGLGGSPLASILDLFTVRVPSPPRAAGAMAQPARLDPADSYAMLLLESTNDIRRAKAWQTVILGALFIVWAMSTYGAAFDGTVGGLVTAFLSAFGVDVGLDALLARVKGAALG